MIKQVVRWSLPLVLQALSVGCFELSGLPMSNLNDAGDAGGFGKTDAGAQQTSEAGGPAWEDSGVGVDAGLADAAADAAAPAVACDVAHPCAASELCAPDGFCVEKCSASGACVVATSATGFGQLIADGPTLYYTTEPSRDAYGNSLRDGALWKLAAGGELSKLATVQDAPVWNLQERGGFLFWNAASQVWRAPKDGSAPPQALYRAVLGARVLTDTQLAVMNLTAQGGCALALGSLDGAGTPVQTVELMAQQSCANQSFAERHLYYLAMYGEVMSVDLETGQAQTTQLHADNLIAVVPPKLYFRTTVGSHLIQRSDLNDPMGEAEVVYQPPLELRDTGSASLLLRGDWLYHLTTYQAPETRVQVVRASLTALGNAQTLVSRTWAPPRAFALEERFAVTDTNLFVVARLGGYGADPRRGGLLYAVPLPAR